MRVHPVISSLVWILISIVLVVILFNVKMVKVSDQIVIEVAPLTADQRQEVDQDITDRRK